MQQPENLPEFVQVGSERYSVPEFRKAAVDGHVTPDMIDDAAWYVIDRFYLGVNSFLPRSMSINAVKVWQQAEDAYLSRQSEAVKAGQHDSDPVIVKTKPVFNSEPGLYKAMAEVGIEYLPGEEPIQAFYAYEWQRAQMVMEKLGKFIRRFDGNPIDAETLFLLRQSLVDISRTPNRLVLPVNVAPAAPEDFPAKISFPGGLVPAIQAHHFGQQFGFRANDRRVTLIRHLLEDGSPTTYEVVKDDMRNLLQAPDISEEIKRLLKGRDEGLYDVPWANPDFVDALFNFSVSLEKPAMEYVRSDKDKTVVRDFATKFKLIPRTQDKSLAGQLITAIGPLAVGVDIPIELAVYMEGQPASHLVMMMLFLQPTLAKCLKDVPKNVDLIDRWTSALMSPSVCSELPLVDKNGAEVTPRQAYTTALDFVRSTENDLRLMNQNRVALARNYSMFVRYEPFMIPSGSYDVSAAALLASHITGHVVRVKSVPGFLPLAMLPNVRFNSAGPLRFVGEQVYHPQLSVGAGKELFHAKDVASYSDDRTTDVRPDRFIIAIPTIRRVRMTNRLGELDVASDEDRLDVDTSLTISNTAQALKSLNLGRDDAALFWCPPLSCDDFDKFPPGAYSFLGSVSLTDPCGWYRFDFSPRAPVDFMLVVPTIDHRKSLAVLSNIVSAFKDQPLTGLVRLYRYQRAKATQQVAMVRCMDRDLSPQENDNVVEFKSVSESKPMFVDISANATFDAYLAYNFADGRKTIKDIDAWDDFN